jgi:hypothetical protein
VHRARVVNLASAWFIKRIDVAIPSGDLKFFGSAGG